jgi:hypothetical protein
LAIFGITEVPTEGVEFDTSDFVVEGSTESLDVGGTTTTTTTATEPPGRNYMPPTPVEPPKTPTEAAIDANRDGEPPRISSRLHPPPPPPTPDASTIEQQRQHQQQQSLPLLYELD